MARHTNRAFTEELPQLLSQKGMSIRALAREVGVSDAHLSRVLRDVEHKRISPELASRVALALGLDHDYFTETREGFVIDSIKADPALRERLYVQLRSPRSTRRTG